MSNTENVERLGSFEQIDIARLIEISVRKNIVVRNIKRLDVKVETRHYNSNFV